MYVNPIVYLGIDHDLLLALTFEVRACPVVCMEEKVAGKFPTVFDQMQTFLNVRRSTVCQHSDDIVMLMSYLDRHCTTVVSNF